MSKESESNSVSVREHGKGDLGVKSINEMITVFQNLNVPGAN